MKIGLAQLNPTVGDLAGNAEQIRQAAHRSVSQGVRLLLTPELSLCGYPPRDLLMRRSFVDDMQQMLERLATELPAELAVLIGFAEANVTAPNQGGKPLHNSTALLLDGRIQQIFHKRLLPTYDVFDEDRYFEPGYQVNRFQLDSITFGVTVCEDLWNDEEFWGKRTYKTNPIAELNQLGVDLVVNLSASPYSVGKQRLREAMLSHSAKRYSCPIIYTNQVGGNDDLIFDGSSLGVDRQGNLVSRLPAFVSDLAVIEYDPVSANILPASVTPLPTSEAAELWSALVLGVQDYGRKCGFSKAVIGLSGGIDSSLVAAIAVAAFGPENVLGVLMPSPYSSEHSVADAAALAENLGIRTETLPIGELMQGYDTTFSDLFAGTEFGVAEENIQSRIRGSLLMAVSNKFGYLLLSTGNKSEMAVGYCTLYGDMNGGLAVIADVPKTKVYEICRWLNHPHHSLTQPSTLKTHSPIPPGVLSKPPSAELKPDQKDSDSLPSYEVLDDILERLVQRQESAAQIVQAGHEAAVVDRVIQLVSRAEFKRRQAPPVLKVTDRAFGMGWRMPIASRWSSHLPEAKLTADTSVHL
ncbi:MAG: NAD+ synthase [Leptolyngbyaceae cyanobacterium SL_1_1]|nr:NAD+ synthase [Leptolyngbyaceae cyanobacterium RM1_1_2]NJO08507.1 NAD+ synthase [Leptolyngbyaceae cyanobacterium SL_1_1]